MIYETDAYATFWSNVRSSLAGGSLANYLLQNSPALTWWNANNGTKHIVPDGATLGADSSQWDPLIKQQRHYAKGAPLESVGELGYLPIGRWMTINLYPHGHNSIPVNSDNSPLLPPCGFHPVLDYFTVRPPNSIGRGLVNLGGQNTNVQACVFDQMPLDEWNGPGAAKKLEVDDARGFGHWLAAHCGSVTNLSDLGKFWSGADAQPLGEQDGLANNLSYPASILANRINDSLGIGEFEREAVIRNAVQLYTMRQQIYTIIVRADAMSFEYGMSDQNSVTANALNNGSVLSSAQAVFQVWRDPVADANGKHPCFVRLCKILSL